MKPANAYFKSLRAALLIACLPLILISLSSRVEARRHGPAIVEVPIGPTIYNLSTPDMQYYVYRIHQPMVAVVSLWITGNMSDDYDLYGKFTPGVMPTLDDTDFGQPIGGNVSEVCSAELEPGAYYFMVHHYGGGGTYDIGVYGWKTANHHSPNVTSVWRNDTKRGTAMRFGFRPWNRLFVTPDQTYYIPFDMNSHNPTVFSRDNKARTCYENHEVKLTLFYHRSKTKVFCNAVLLDKMTGAEYKLITFEEE